MLIIDELATHSSQEIEPDVGRHEDLVLVEIEEDCLAILSNRLLSHVEYKSVEVTELAHGEVCALGSFTTL